MTLSTKIRVYTEQLNQRGLLRSRSISEPTDSKFIHFDSNDYLSLLGDKRIARAYQYGYGHYSSGSGASMMLSGYHANHKALESAFAQFLGVDDCIIFSSGYAANTAVANLLGTIKAHALIDKELHASMYDGLRLSQTDYSRYHHNNLDDLSKKLKTHVHHSVVITEGIFSMSGQKAPLSRMNQLCQPAQTALIVDEAHSFGILGINGAGAVDAHQLTQKEVPLRIIPLGKAFVGQGAVVAGHSDWIKALLQVGRSVIYSTSVSPALSYGLLKTLDIVHAAEDRREGLRGLIACFREQIGASPLNWSDSNTAIQQVRLGCPHKTLHYARELKNLGISCSAIRSPTVTLKNTGLRIVLNYRHTVDQIKFLFENLHFIYEYSSH